MGDIIYFTTRYAKEENKMNNVVTQIRSKSKEIEDMPQRAQEVLDYFKITDFSEGVPIIGILKEMGFKNYQKELKPEKMSAYIAIDPKFFDAYGTNKITCLQKNESLGHKRFALAHELGHYLFDFNEEQELSYYNTYMLDADDSDPIEKRANKFAANLLMPEKEFQAKHKECQNLHSKADTVVALSQYFRVSPTAVLRRFEELGIEGYSE